MSAPLDYEPIRRREEDTKAKPDSRRGRVSCYLFAGSCVISFCGTVLALSGSFDIFRAVLTGWFVGAGISLFVGIPIALAGLIERPPCRERLIWRALLLHGLWIVVPISIAVTYSALDW